MVLTAAPDTLLATAPIGGTQASGRATGTTITTGTTRPVRSVVFA